MVRQPPGAARDRRPPRRRSWWTNASWLAVTLSSVLFACGRYQYEDLALLGGSGSGGSGLDDGAELNSSLDGGVGGVCSLGTYADCSACGESCGALSLPGALDYACVSGACQMVSCDVARDDCDGDLDNGCEADLASIEHCGRCDRACAFDNAQATCAAGQCAIASCEQGFGDCDGDPDNGCERALNDLNNCGGCGVPCSLPNATASCQTGSCQLLSCDNGFDDCDDDPGNGCETPLDTLTDCSACGVLCDIPAATESCAGGVCSQASCAGGFADCDGDGASCETSLNTLTDCVGCGVQCGDGSGRLANATASCASGSCGIGSCDSGFDDCDFSAGNGCETPTTTLADCGACGASCTRANATATCSTGSCAIQQCSSGFGNCDLDDGTGCETPLGTDAHCTGCNQPCGVNEACSSGQCVGQFATFTPSNIDPGPLDPGSAPDVTLGCGNATLNTGTLAANFCGETPDLVVQEQSSGPDLLVVSMKSFVVQAGTTLTVTGSRPVAFAVFGDATIAGTLDVGANGSSAGPGDHWNCLSQGARGLNGFGTSEGGGGGGGGGALGNSGGRGGDSSGGSGNSGGSARGAASLAPLIPGCNGGWGGGCGAPPGGGGGAVQLAVSGRLDVTGNVLSNGEPGVDGCGTRGGASGGGSGGAILIQANQVVVGAGANLQAVGANGGRGANGGNGGVGSATGAGQNGASSGNGGGGGGGSAGRIRIEGAQVCTLSGAISPAASTACP